MTPQTVDILIQLIDGSTVSPAHPQAQQVLAALMAARAEVLGSVDTDNDEQTQE